MTTDPQRPVAPTDRIHPTKARRAFLEDNADLRPATLTGVDGDQVSVTYIGRGVETVLRVRDRARFAAVVERDDLCRYEGRPLLMVNPTYRLLGVATGPAVAPSSVAMLIVCRLEDGTVVELVNSDDDQPSWQTFALRPT